MSMEDLLRGEIEANLENMNELELGSKQYESAVDDDYDLKNQARETEAELKNNQLVKDKRNQMIQNGIAVGSIVVSTAVTIWGTLASFKFEKEGTVTTILGRAFVGKLLPKK